MFTIETNSGKSIRGMSYFQNEDEILLPPGRYLRVIDKWSPAPDLHIIHLREVQPPYRMLADPFDLSQLKQNRPQSNPADNAPIATENLENKPPIAIRSIELETAPVVGEQLKNTSTRTEHLGRSTSMPVATQYRKSLYLI